MTGISLEPPELRTRIGQAARQRVEFDFDRDCKIDLVSAIREHALATGAP